MQINDVKAIAITKLDVLSGLETVKICTAYRHGGRTLSRFPSDLSTLEACTPIYEEFAGWPEDITGCRRRGDLPRNAQRYLDCIAEGLGVKIHIVSVGGSREQTIFLVRPRRR